jgi:hypothetical protein
MSTTQQAKSWRDVLPVHPAAELIPPISADELRVLSKDIKEHGIRIPIMLWAEAPGLRYSLLDGRSRLDAMELAGIKITFNKRGVPDVPCIYRYGYRDKYSIAGEFTDTDPYAYVISANLHRRHLTAGQKDDLIRNLLKAKPETPNLQIAKQVKRDDKTVAKIRRELEERSEIPNVKTRTDSKGRKQPARRGTTDAIGSSGQPIQAEILTADNAVLDKHACRLENSITRALNELRETDQYRLIERLQTFLSAMKAALHDGGAWELPSRRPDRFDLATTVIPFPQGQS